MRLKQGHISCKEGMLPLSQHAGPGTRAHLLASFSSCGQPLSKSCSKPTEGTLWTVQTHETRGCHVHMSAVESRRKHRKAEVHVALHCVTNPGLLRWVKRRLELAGWSHCSTGITLKVNFHFQDLLCWERQEGLEGHGLELSLAFNLKLPTVTASKTKFPFSSVSFPPEDSAPKTF